MACKFGKPGFCFLKFSQLIFSNCGAGEDPSLVFQMRRETGRRSSSRPRGGGRVSPSPLFPLQRVLSQPGGLSRGAAGPSCDGRGTHADSGHVAGALSAAAWLWALSTCKASARP